MIVDPDLPGLATKITQNYSNAQIAQLIRMISPVSPCALMAADEFERVMAVLAGQNRRRAFSDRSISAARLVLVMGASVSEAALMHRNFKMPMHEPDAMTEASGLHSDA